MATRKSAYPLREFRKQVKKLLPQKYQSFIDKFAITKTKVDKFSSRQPINKLLDPLNTFRIQVKREIGKDYPTVEKFCVESGIQKSILSRLLSGKQKEFKIETLKRVAKALGKTVEVRLK